MIQVKSEIPVGHLFTEDNYRAKAPWLDTVPEATESEYNLEVSPDPFQQLDRNTVSLVDNHELEFSSEAEQIYPWGYISTPSKDDHHIGFNKYASKEHTTLGYSSSYPGASGIFGEGIRGYAFNGDFWDRRQSGSSVSDFSGSPVSGHTMQSEVDMLPDAQMDDGLTFAENFSHQGPSTSPQATSSSSASASVSAAPAGRLRRSVTSLVAHHQASSPLAQEHTCPDSDDEVEDEDEHEDTKKPSKKQQTPAVSGSVPKGTRPFARHSKAGNVHYVVPAGADVRFTCTYPMGKKDGTRDTICGKTFEKTHKIRLVDLNFLSSSPFLLHLLSLYKFHLEITSMFPG